MAAQYDVNLREMCAIEVFVWTRLLQDRPGAFTCSYIFVIFGHTDKVAYIFRICKDSTFICVHSE